MNDCTTPSTTKKFLFHPLFLNASVNWSHNFIAPGCFLVYWMLVLSFHVRSEKKRVLWIFWVALSAWTQDYDCHKPTTQQLLQYFRQHIHSLYLSTLFSFHTMQTMSPKTFTLHNTFPVSLWRFFHVYSVLIFQTWSLICRHIRYSGRRMRFSFRCTGRTDIKYNITLFVGVPLSQPEHDNYIYTTRLECKLRQGNEIVSHLFSQSSRWWLI